MTRQLQREVGFDRRIHFARSAVINIPTTIRQLSLQNVPDTALLNDVVDFAQPVHEQDEIGAERAVDKEFAAPMTIGMLLPKQILLGPRDGRRNIGRRPRR